MKATNGTLLRITNRGWPKRLSIRGINAHSTFSFTPDGITASLGVQPRKVIWRGEQRRNSIGEPLTGTHELNHWSADLAIVNGHDIDEFLLDLVDTQIFRWVELTKEIDETGGEVEVFIGVFTVELCDSVIPASTLRLLGQAGISVRFDFYGPDNRKS